MKPSSIFNLAGISLQFIGVAVLSRVDLNAYALETAKEAIRPSALTEVYEAARDGKEHELSTQESHVQALESRRGPSVALFRGALLLVLLGTALQFIGAWLSE